MAKESHANEPLILICYIFFAISSQCSSNCNAIYFTVHLKYNTVKELRCKVKTEKRYDWTILINIFLRHS